MHSLHLREALPGPSQGALGSHLRPFKLAVWAMGPGPFFCTKVKGPKGLMIRAENIGFSFSSPTSLD